MASSAGSSAPDAGGGGWSRGRGRRWDGCGDGLRLLRRGGGRTQGWARLRRRNGAVWDGLGSRRRGPVCRAAALRRAGRNAPPAARQQYDKSQQRHEFFHGAWPPFRFYPVFDLFYPLGTHSTTTDVLQKATKRAENAACRRGRRHFSVFILFTPWKRRIPPVWPGGPGAFQPGPARPPPRGRGPC